jgi:hypothetical protein
VNQYLAATLSSGTLQKCFAAIYRNDSIK